MRDPHFEETLILLCQHDDEGALGIVINRSCPISIGEILKQTELPHTQHKSQSALWGGPVGEGACFLIWKGEIPPKDGWSLEQGLAVSPSKVWLQKLVDEDNFFEIAIGYSGWGPGQLDHEIGKGSWLYTDIDSDVVLETPLEERYEKALSSLGLSKTTVWMQPIDE
jgi:putative transcriptional regulator